MAHRVRSWRGLLYHGGMLLLPSLALALSLPLLSFAEEAGEKPVAACEPAALARTEAKVSVYETRYFGKRFASRRREARFGAPALLAAPGMVFDLYPAKEFQAIRGFGANLTESCAINLLRLPEPRRKRVMERLFAKENGAGFDFLRIPIGASDFADGAKGSYSYDDTPGNEPDPRFTQFDMSRDEKTLALLREARRINPDLEILITPWTAPAWMKTNKNLHYGNLAPEHYQDYANYFVKVIRAFERRGVPVRSLSVVNEPGYATTGYPSMMMSAEDQIMFVGRHLGPTLERWGLRPLIFGLDHNWDMSEQANQLLADPVASRYYHGIAYHCYGGYRWAMHDTFNAHPGKEVIQTECTGTLYDDQPPPNPSGDFLWWMENQAVDAVQMGTSGGMGWNLCLDEKNGPQNGIKDGKDNGGCDHCRGLVRTDFSGAKPKVTYHPEYHGLAQLSRFVRKGARRVELKAKTDENVYAVAVKNPDGSMVFVALNKNNTPLAFQLRRHAADCLAVSYQIPARGAVTLTWID